MAKHKDPPRPEMVWIMVPTGEICQQLGLSRSTFRRWRKFEVVTEGIHWMYRPGTKARVLWNLDLMRDFVANSGDCPAHQRSILLYVKSLPSSK